MGVTGLTTFINRYFHCWESRKLEGNLVIDGHSLCHKLYTYDWNRGGEYPQFREQVLALFNSLLATKVNPIVVFDGIDYAKQKVHTTMKRRREWIKFINENIASSTQAGKILPLLAHEVFRLALQEANVPFYVVDGEADETIVKIANYFQCPVLGLDSDYFMFNIAAGYIPIDRFNSETDLISCEIFYLSNFQKQFGFKNESLCFMIPAIMGNDFHSGVFSDRLITLMSEPYQVCVHDLHPVAQIVKCISQCPSEDSLFSGLKGLSCYDQLRSNFLKSKSLYVCEECINPIWLLTSSALKTVNGESLSEWLIEKYRQGNFFLHSMNALVMGQCILRIVPDVSMKVTSTAISISIRQKMYFLLNIPTVTEYTRIGMDLSGRKVSALPVTNISKFGSLSPFANEVFYEILDCDIAILSRVAMPWRFVVAVTKFWAKTANVPTSLVEALIYCNILCFTYNDNLNDFRNKCHPLSTFQRSKWMVALHAFSQWQCCYLDSLSVNQLLVEPFQIVSPALLYDGTIALHMAKNVSSVPSDFPIDRQLFTIISSIVLHERYASASSVSKATPKTGSLQTTATTESSAFSHANPFSLLQTDSDSD